MSASKHQHITGMERRTALCVAAMVLLVLSALSATGTRLLLLAEEADTGTAVAQRDEMQGFPPKKRMVPSGPNQGTLAMHGGGQIDGLAEPPPSPRRLN
ncbi:hypothetical protein BHE74_00020389 [Ensete ventricosum]|uniref:Uncharacterized protein n=1 Tax=Ensete ventricosum TaxID=4639 RepID=A0A444FXW0_ENSVE|nr:hypothetical protein B296_00056518 [Ensete ventricosum]RWW27484.1 hypothetical protein GW17_00008093 [Ensete ventricosum]RWW71838.1 hypothetical protein BHE74_00020389 [Ensete ventricosum]RZR72769.1 hypothetical protein BHM03_00016924 [Ensete ventricosum]